MRPFLYSLILCCIFLPSTKFKAEAQTTNKIIIQLKLDDAKENELLRIKIGSAIEFASEYPDRKIFQSSLDTNGIFKFDIEVGDRFGYFVVERLRTFTENGKNSGYATVVSPQLWKAGDSVLINASVKETTTGTHGKYIVEGSGALKYKLDFAIDSIFNQETGESENFSEEKAMREGIVDPYENLRKEAFSYLRKNAKELPKEELDILKVKINYFNGNSIYLPLKAFWQRKSLNRQSIILKTYKDAYNKKFHKEYVTSAKIQSISYLRFMLYRYAAESILINGAPDQKWVYEMIKSENQDQTLTEGNIAVFLSRSRLPGDAIYILEDAANYVRTKDAKTIVDKIFTNTGHRKFKDFNFYNVSDEVVRISKFEGKTILLDFWTNGCGGCKLFYESVLKFAEEKFYTDSSVVFLSVGVERKKDLWIKGLQTGYYTSEKAINIHTGVKGSGHPALAENYIRTYPTVILIGKDGFVYRHNTTDLYEKQSLIDLIGKIK